MAKYRFPAAAIRAMEEALVYYADPRRWGESGHPGARRAINVLRDRRVHKATFDAYMALTDRREKRAEPEEKQP